MYYVSNSKETDVTGSWNIRWEVRCKDWKGSMKEGYEDICMSKNLYLFRR